MVTDKQVTSLFKSYNRNGSKSMSALKSGMSCITATKYLETGKIPSEVKIPHDWSTRTDPFHDVEDQIEEMLENAPELQAMAIFNYLQEKYPDKFDDGALRTLQRRVKKWNCVNGFEKEIFFPQVHHPGEVIELDWTSMNKLEISINGELFKHKLCHCVLVYSNWQWATIAYSESFLSLKKGLQEALFNLGAVPKFIQTDNSSSATHQVSKNKSDRIFNSEYLSFLNHFRLTPRTINISSPEENGTVESQNGHLKNRINQYLLLRGHRDFDCIEGYEKFLRNVFSKANANRTEKVSQELSVMRELPPIRLPEYQEEEHTVNKAGTIRIKKIVYSVPSRLKGTKVRTHIYEDKIKVYHSRDFLFDLPRKHGDRGHCINYRHQIGNLLRKPGAFTDYKYKEAMFPTSLFRMAYDHLEERHDTRRCNRDYLEILNLAASTSESQVELALKHLLNVKTALNVEAVKGYLNIKPDYEIPTLTLVASTVEYDQLLTSFGG